MVRCRPNISRALASTMARACSFTGALPPMLQTPTRQATRQQTAPPRDRAARSAREGVSWSGHRGRRIEGRLVDAVHGRGLLARGESLFGERSRYPRPHRSLRALSRLSRVARAGVGGARRDRGGAQSQRLRGRVRWWWWTVRNGSDAQHRLRADLSVSDATTLHVHDRLTYLAPTAP